MAALPSPTQVAGNHSAIYEAYYRWVDPDGFGTIGAMEAARFLKKSGLSDVVLSRIWDLSDPGGRGCLDKAGLFVALKLIALAQSGRDVNMSNIHLEMPPPKMGDVQLPKPVKPPPPSNTPLITSLPPSAVDWTIKPGERENYEKLFESLKPLNGLIPGNKVKGVLMDSKLPVETLGKIWDLADQDKDGMLDRHEFIAAMHLVYKALEKYAIPSTLPPELVPPAKRKGSTPLGSLDGMKTVMPPPPVVPPQPVVKSMPPQPIQPQVPWVVTPDEKAKSDMLFIKSDVDKDGFVSGQEIKDVFLQSGVPQPVLAHIWALCDIKQSGKLNNEQFALSMWFVARCLKGIDPPPALAPEMVPPSFRSTRQTADGLVENNNTKYSNPELDMISKDIEELAREKLALETDIAQKEADIKIKSGEIKSLQSELDTLAATLKQLENQKGEAQKRLNDLKAQKSTIDSELEEVNNQIEEQTEKVDKLRSQASEQAETVAAQEKELMSKKEQMESLKQEEQRLEQQKSDSMKKLESLTTNLQDTQLNISQAKALITQLQEQTRQINDAIVACDSAIESGDASGVPDTILHINPDYRDAQYSNIGLTNGNSLKQNGFSDDPFSKKDVIDSSGFKDDPFKNDPFKSNTEDAFGSSDPFNAFTSKTNDAFSSDPFNSFNANPSTKADPFDAFGDSQKNTAATQDEKDPFGCDPFAVLHAPTRPTGAPGRPSSPSPALPPKKSKQPPPRPAPPRPTQPPHNKSSSGFQSDPFGTPTSDPFSSSGGGGFADFADFDAKFTSSTVSTTMTTKAAAATTTTKTKATLSSTVTSTKSMDFTDDPFRDYRYEDPFDIAFDEEPEEANKSKFDPFGLDGRQSVPPRPVSSPFTGGDAGLSGRASAPLATKLPSEDQQLAWAAQESLKLEETRRQRQLQEQADLELAISLSKAENKRT